MIIVELNGGLGNQMFQYAVGRRLAILRKTQLQLDTSWYERAAQTDGVGKRVYELHPLAIQENLYSRTLLNRVRVKLLGGQRYTDESQPYTFHPEVLHLPNYSRLFGYFQNPAYFNETRELLQEEFTVKAPPVGKNQQLLEDITSNSRSVSIHVRRGDYVASKTHSAVHGLHGLEYYREAIRRLKQAVQKPTFYVMSDDPDWCKKHLKLNDATVYVGANPGIEGMRLMRACTHNIIANSSFSWWAAWLNANPAKIVVAPKHWINADFDTSTLLPASWIQI